MLAESLKLLVFGPLLIGLLALGIAFLMTPTFTARTTFLPPQQQQSMVSSTLASLGALGGLAGNLGSVKSPADQYAALMKSTTVQDRLVDQYDLMQVYDVEYRFEARKELDDNVNIAVGKKDGLVTVSVDDKDPQRAAGLANSHVEELRRLTDTLAVSEAQQRRVFFEEQLQRSKEQLTEAQRVLQASGFTQGALKAEPRAAADSYARLKAEVTAAEVRLQSVRSSFSENTPEVQQQMATLTALRAQLARAEQATAPQSGNDYIGKYRDFKYEETLFELFARQYEMARVDESREGALIQVVDVATKPEHKSKPKRALIAVAATFGSFILLAGFVIARKSWSMSAASDPQEAEKLRRLRRLLRRQAKQ